VSQDDVADCGEAVIDMATDPKSFVTCAALANGDAKMFKAAVDDTWTEITYPVKES
jgi:WD40 repeat protein